MVGGVQWGTRRDSVGSYGFGSAYNTDVEDPVSEGGPFGRRPSTVSVYGFGDDGAGDDSGISGSTGGGLSAAGEALSAALADQFGFDDGFAKALDEAEVEGDDEGFGFDDEDEGQTADPKDAPWSGQQPVTEVYRMATVAAAVPKLQGSSMLPPAPTAPGRKAFATPAPPSPPAKASTPAPINQGWWFHARKKPSVRADDSWLKGRGGTPMAKVVRPDTTDKLAASEAASVRAAENRRLKEFAQPEPQYVPTQEARSSLVSRGSEISRGREGSLKAETTSGVTYSSRPPMTTVTPASLPTSASAKVDFSLLQSTMDRMRGPNVGGQLAGKRAVGRTTQLELPMTQSNNSRLAPASAPVGGRSASTVFADGIMQTVDEIEAGGGPNSHEYEEIDTRALEAAKWTNRSIRDLIAEIKTHGNSHGGVCHVTFGVLFQATANKFDALAGLLKTAKKYNVIEYEGEQLWQRVHDHVMISLLKEDFAGIRIRRRSKANIKKSMHSAAATSSKGFGNVFRPGERCASAACNRVVYQNDCVVAGGKQYCRACFRCGTCNKVLKQSDYSVSRDKAHRCAKCHREFEMKAF